jgi:CubicO group peptidase (beta-lactamase class C family)
MTAAPLPSARPEEVGLAAPRLARIGEALGREIEHKRIPGAVALVARRGKLAYFESFGVRDPASGAPMEKDAIFRIYSMTKPIVSVAAMMMVEEGRLLLSDPLGRYLPDFAEMKVATGRADGRLDLVPAARPITLQDLLRHTSGVTYEHMATGALQRRYSDARTSRRDQTNAELAARLATVPLADEPGTRWRYGHSTDLLGRVLEVVSDRTLGDCLAERVLSPLGMTETRFSVPAGDHHRLAEPFPKDPESGAPVSLIDVKAPPQLQSGGGGLTSTTADYTRFVQMLANGGTLDGVRLLSRKTVDYMAADHLGAIAPAPSMLSMLPEGFGFGLGFAVRREAGIATVPGSVGQYYWSGVAGTSFWIDPAEQLCAILMTQGPGQREYFRALFRNLVYGAVAD